MLMILPIFNKKQSRLGGRRAPTSTWCQLGTLRETVKLPLSARRSSTTRLSSYDRRVGAPKFTLCTPRNTKHHSPSSWKGVAPLSYTPTMENGLGSSIFLPDHGLRCQRLKSTRRRGGVNERDITETTTSATNNSSEHSFKNMNFSPSLTREHVENHPPNLTKHQTSQPQ
jgi:hypothetical protein